MVRSTVLSILFLTPATGLWIDSNGTRREVPCPQSFQEESLVRLPAGCKLDAPAVAFTRSEYLKNEEYIAQLMTQRDHWEQVAQREKKLREQVEQDLDALIIDFELQFKILQSTCKSELDCPTVKPALIGGALTFSLCAGAWATSKMLK